MIASALLHLGALAAAFTTAHALLGALASATQAGAATTAVSTANPFMWYATRAASVSAYILLTLTVAMGLARSLTHAARVRVSWLVEENHQILAAITAVFVALHLLTLLLDPLIPFSLLNLIVPVGEPYSPVAVALGVIALYGMVAVLLSSWLRRRMSYRSWRTLHYASFVTFWLVTAHGVFAGSDTRQPWMYLIYIVSALVVAGGTLLRIFWRTPAQPAQPAFSQARRAR
jgi:predicted ferric reductase